MLAWEPEPNNLEDAKNQVAESMPEIPVSQNLLEHHSSSSHDTPILSENLPTTRDQEQAQTPVDLPLSRDIEDPSELLLPVTEPDIPSTTLLPEEADSWSAPKSKKDKKKRQEE